jgi:hypothetical protein
MTSRVSLHGLSARIVEVHEMLESMHVRHQFGGAIALAWYRNPRATTDIDLNVTLSPEFAAPVLGAFEHLGVSITDADRAVILSDGQARLEWGESLLDVFFATIALHEEMADRARIVEFGPAMIPILSPEDLIICKAVFDRPKDWVDIQAMVEWGTPVDSAVIQRWITEILGSRSETWARLSLLISGTPGEPGGQRG